MTQKIKKTLQAKKAKILTKDEGESSNFTKMMVNTIQHRQVLTGFTVRIRRSSRNGSQTSYREYWETTWRMTNAEIQIKRKEGHNLWSEIQ